MARPPVPSKIAYGFHLNNFSFWEFCHPYYWARPTRNVSTMQWRPFNNAFILSYCTKLFVYCIRQRPKSCLKWPTVSRNRIKHVQNTITSAHSLQTKRSSSLFVYSLLDVTSQSRTMILRTLVSKSSFASASRLHFFSKFSTMASVLELISFCNVPCYATCMPCCKFGKQCVVCHFGRVVVI